MMDVVDFIAVAIIVSACAVVLFRRLFPGRRSGVHATRPVKEGEAVLGSRLERNLRKRR